MGKLTVRAITTMELACVPSRGGAGRKGQRLSADLLFDLSRESDR